jgi:hypothetical protein
MVTVAREARSKSASKSGKASSAGEVRYGENVGTAFIDGVTFRSKPVQYTEIEGMAVVEGDINLGPVERVQQQTEMRRAELTGAPIAAAALVSGSQSRWPNCTVPYQIDAELPKQARVTDAIAHWEASTAFNFVHRTPSNEAQYPDYVEFVPGNGCSSYVGRQGGRQTITLGPDCSTGNTIHEIGHAVGLWHEQSREDRDAFVTIQWTNIIPAALNNFAQHITDGEDVGPYDFSSIMHYPRDAFSSNGEDTIVPIDPDAEIGQRNGLSIGDVAAVNSLCGGLVGETPARPPIANMAGKPMIADTTDKLATGREPTKHIPKEPLKDLLKDWPKNPPKDRSRDWPKNPSRDWRMDWPKEMIQDRPRIDLKLVKEWPKEMVRDWKDWKFVAKELPKDPPEEERKGFDPGPWPGPGPGPFGSAGAPFVLATGGPPPGFAGPQPAGDAEQQLTAYREALERFAGLHAQGLLGPADMALWQEYATAAQQLVDG